MNNINALLLRSSSPFMQSTADDGIKAVHKQDTGQSVIEKLQPLLSRVVQVI